MMRLLVAFFMCLILNNGVSQYSIFGMGLQVPRKSEFTIHTPTYTTQEGAQYSFGETEEFSQVTGFDVLLKYMFNYKFLFFNIEMNLFNGYEEFKVPINHPSAVNSSLIESTLVSVDNEHIGFGFELMSKTSKYMNGFLPSVQFRFKTHSVYSYSAPAPLNYRENETDKEGLAGWGINNHSEWSVNFGINFRYNWLMAFARYTPAIRFTKHLPGYSFSKWDIGVVILGKTWPTYGRQHIFVP